MVILQRCPYIRLLNCGVMLLSVVTACWKGFRNKGCWPARVSWQLRGRTVDSIKLHVASVLAEMRTRLLTSLERDIKVAVPVRSVAVSFLNT